MEKPLSRFDRYVLAQLMLLFGFFSLILVAVYWINQAVRVFDQLIADGQRAWAVLTLSALSLPLVIAIVMPMAAFAAAVYDEQAKFRQRASHRSSNGF